MAYALLWPKRKAINGLFLAFKDDDKTVFNEPLFSTRIYSGAFESSLLQGYNCCNPNVRGLYSIHKLSNVFIKNFFI